MNTKTLTNVVVWFDIPVKDLKRAITFYSKVLGIEMQIMEMGPTKMACFPYEPGAVSGALTVSKDLKPSTEGTLIYLSGGEDLSVPLKRVKAAGGKVIKDKTSIGEHGFMAIFQDTEGNHIGLHSMK
jgi:uncharacterized protein